MSAFDLFQDATCDIGEGNHAAAAATLAEAVAQIDATGEDLHMRDDLEALRVTLINKAPA